MNWNVCVLGTTYSTNVHIENTLTAMSHDGRRLPKVFLQSRKLLLLKFKFSFGVAVRAKSSLAHLSNGLSCIHRNQWKRLCLIKTFCSGSEKKMLKHFYSFPCFNSSLKLNSVGPHTHITNIYGSIVCKRACSHQEIKIITLILICPFCAFCFAPAKPPQLARLLLLIDLFQLFHYRQSCTASRDLFRRRE